MTRHTVAIDQATTKANWETPPKVFEKLNDDFGPFDLDLTADPQRSLCGARFLGPGSALASDALSAPWSDFGASGYSNPPYGVFVPQMLAQAVRQRDLGFTSTLLLPMRVTKAFTWIIVPEANELWFCDKRICFYENGEPRWNAKALAEGRYVPDPAMFDSIIVRFLPGLAITRRLETDIWHVPAHVPARIV